jgi:hypothetical protein
MRRPGTAAAAWAFWKALVNLGPEKEADDDVQAPAHDDLFRWRHSPRQIIGLIIADHARSAGR